eukprot:3844965-Pyramimonas_sp.AAC.1
MGGREGRGWRSSGDWDWLLTHYYIGGQDWIGLGLGLGLDWIGRERRYERWRFEFGFASTLPHFPDH